MIETYTILQEKNSLLYQPSHFFNFEKDMDPEKLFWNMKYTVQLNSGCGLAANQVGFLKRFFVIYYTGQTKIFFNPKILEKSNETIKYSEGCLSFPGLILDIERPTSISVEYQDEKGNTKTEKYSGMWSRIFQHELDHIDGITFDQRVSKLKLDFARKKRRKHFQ